jgi:hypothetical protein
LCIFSTSARRSAARKSLPARTRAAGLRSGAVGRVAISTVLSTLCAVVCHTAHQASCGAEIRAGGDSEARLRWQVLFGFEPTGSFVAGAALVVAATVICAPSAACRLPSAVAARAAGR